MEALVVDLFAGGGGASIGIEAALGSHVDLAINHNPIAIAVHKRNHPRTRHLTTSIWDVDPIEACAGHPVLYLHASPDCTHFSRAKGSKPRKQEIRSLADVVIVWAEKKRPLVISLENVAEFQEWGPLGEDDKPIKERKGEDFNAWVGKLRALGYAVEWKVLDASLYGAPTKRKRLFVVARRDGLPIVWPTPTHGPGLLPFHTAAECIDWSIPCPSIFERKRPLAPKTMARIAGGIRKFVLENPRPFIIPVNHGGGLDRANDLLEPLPTVTAARRSHALVAPTMVQTGYGEREGQAPRVLNLQAPLGTVVAGGAKQALVSAFLAKHFGGHTTPGGSLRDPASTITAQDHHALVTSQLVKLRGTSEAHVQSSGQDVEAPLPTVTASGNHIAEVRAFLAAYYGSKDIGQSPDDPLRTVVTKDRFGLVVVEGVEHVIVDIGMRMLKWHELLRAQFGRFAATYDMSPAESEAEKVRLIGNSVCPEVMEALARANLPAPLMRRAA